MRTQLLALLILAACGDVEPSFPDAGDVPDAPLPPDAPPPACDPTAPFGTPVPVPGLNSKANEYTAALSADGLTVFVGSDRNGKASLVYAAARATVDEPFGQLREVQDLNAASADTFPGSLSADGLSLYLLSDRAGTGSSDLYVATRPTAAASFTEPTELVNLNSGLADVHPFATADHRALYFSSLRAGNGDLYRAARRVDGTFEAPVALTELNTASFEGTSVVSRDELTIYFSSAEDIYVARRAAATEPFGEPVAVDELNEIATLERPYGISPDQCTLWFVSSGHGSQGGVDVFAATRPR